MPAKQVPVGTPAAAGLAGFGLATFIPQIHILGFCGAGPVVACGIIFGGLVQLMAGLQEFKEGNNFGCTLFCSYGAFWITLCIILFFDKYDIYASNSTDLGWFLVVWTLYTMILWFGAMRIHAAMATTFTLLVIGFILLDLAHFGYPALTKVASWLLIGCALSAWYMMAHVIFLQVFGRDMLPVGKPWIEPNPTSKNRNGDTIG